MSGNADHKFILDRRCQFSIQIPVICGKFWFSAFVSRKLRLRLIESSQVFTYGEPALSERTCEWFQRFKSGDFYVEGRHGGGKKKIFEDSELVALLAEDAPNRNWIDRIIGSNSTSHFETRQSHGNNSEARKLGSIRVEAERCSTASLLVNNCLKNRIGRGFNISLWPVTKNGSTTIIPSAVNHGECPDMPPRRLPDRIFTIPRLCSTFVDQLCVVYYELLNPSETIKGDRYRTQLMRLSRDRLRLENTEIGGLTLLAVLSRRCSFRLPFVSISGTRLCSSAFPLLWRSQKMDRFVDCLKRCRWKKSSG